MERRTGFSVFSLVYSVPHLSISGGLGFPWLWIAKKIANASPSPLRVRAMLGERLLLSGHLVVDVLIYSSIWGFDRCKPSNARAPRCAKHLPWKKPKHGIIIEKDIWKGGLRWDAPRWAAGGIRSPAAIMYPYYHFIFYIIPPHI